MSTAKPAASQLLHASAPHAAPVIERPSASSPLLPLLDNDACQSCPTGLGWDCQFCYLPPHSAAAVAPSPLDQPAQLNASIFIIHLQPDILHSRVSLLTAGTLQQLGYIPGEFSADSELWANIIHPDDKQAVEILTREAVESRQPRQRDYRLRHASSGLYHWVSDSITPVSDPNGAVSTIVGVARVLASGERPLPPPPTQAHLGLLLEAFPDPALISGHLGRILQLNSSLSRLLGVPPENLIGQPVEALFPHLAAEPDSPFPAARQCQIRHHDGHLIPVDFHFSSIAGFQESLSLITVRDRSQLSSVFRRLAFQSAVVDAADEGIIGAGPNGIIDYWNKAAERLSGYQAHEAIGRHLLMLFTPGPFTASLTELQTFASPAPTARFETRFIRRDQSEITVSAIGAPVHGDGGLPIGISVVFRDISEQKRAENALKLAKSAAEAASRAKGAFIANISHELRTPLSDVIGLTELLLSTEHDALEADHLATINSSANSLLAIIDNILLISRLESGRFLLSTQPFVVADLFDRCRREFAATANEKGLAFDLSIHPSVPPVLYGDFECIREIAHNLIENAIKFTHRGRIDVEVAASPDDPANLLLRVRDTGIGVPPAHRRSIFEPFTQVDDSLRREFGGAGLGLAICDHLAEMMGGRIWVDSDGVSGSIFTVSLQLQAPSAADTDGPPPPPVVSDRRASDRTPATGHLLLRILRPFSPVALEGVAVDTSPGGMRIRIPQLLDHGSIVQIEWNGHIAVGDVRYCIPSAGAYFAGLRHIR